MGRLKGYLEKNSTNYSDGLDIEVTEKGSFKDAF